MSALKFDALREKYAAFVPIPFAQRVKRKMKKVFLRLYEWYYILKRFFNSTNKFSGGGIMQIIRCCIDLKSGIESWRVNREKGTAFIFRRKEECCGCTACYAICPQSAITMVEDEEGFKYPQADETKCVGCHICLTVCPMKVYA